MVRQELQRHRYPPLWMRQLSLFEQLLCRHLCTSRPMEYTQQYILLIRDMLKDYQDDRWSLESFIHDMRKEYVALDINRREPTGPRPNNNRWPIIPRFKVESLKSVPPYQDEAPFKYAFRLADQLYNTIRSAANLPFKHIMEAMKERGLRPMHLTESEEHLMHITTIEARETYLEDRTAILERREEILLCQLQSALRDISLYKQANCELARRLAGRSGRAMSRSGQGNDQRSKP